MATITVKIYAAIEANSLLLVKKLMEKYEGKLGSFFWTALKGEKYEIASYIFSIDPSLLFLDEAFRFAPYYVAEMLMEQIEAEKLRQLIKESETYTLTCKRLEDYLEGVTQ